MVFANLAFKWEREKESLFLVDFALKINLQAVETSFSKLSRF